MSIESIKVPDLGGAEAVEVIEICVAVGDTVAAEDSIVVLESDKASMEVPSPKAGKVVAIKVADGDSLSEGDVILELETEGAVASDTTATTTAATATAPSEPDTTAPEQKPAPASSADSVEEGTSQAAVNVPDLGGAENVDVIEVCVAAGDEIAEGDSLIVLETDKASMEVPAPRAGKVITVSIAEGDTVSAGQEILILESAGKAANVSATTVQPATDAVTESVAQTVTETVTTEAKKSEPSAIPAPSYTPSEPQPVAEKEQAEKRSSDAVYAGPAVRKLAREMGITLDKVKGSGPRGRITKDDLKAFVKTELTSKSSAVATHGGGVPAVPEIDFSQYGEVSIEPLSKIHKVTAENMHRSWLNVPHVTQFDEADITELEDFRQSIKAEAEQRGVKVTPIPFLLKACAAALKANPKFNASLHADGKSMVYKKYVHIGMAVDTPAGLVVPVIRDVDQKSIWEIAAEVAELAKKAKDRKLSMAEMQGGCFSISSLGNIGGQGFTPIVNTPEVGILAVSKLSVKPVWNGSEFVPRKMLPLSLSYDHRAVNGADAGRFFTYLNELLADIRRLVL